MVPKSRLRYVEGNLPSCTVTSLSLLPPVIGSLSSSSFGGRRSREPCIPAAAASSRSRRWLTLKFFLLWGSSGVSKIRIVLGGPDLSRPRSLSIPLALVTLLLLSPPSSPLPQIRLLENFTSLVLQTSEKKRKLPFSSLNFSSNFFPAASPSAPLSNRLESVLSLN